MAEGQLFQLAFLVCLLAYLLSFQFNSKPELQRSLRVISVTVLAIAIMAAFALWIVSPS